MLTTTSRVLKFSAATIWRNLWLSIITVTTITLTLLSISLVVALQVGISDIVKTAEHRIDLSVYFFPKVTEAQVQSVVDSVKNFSGITSVETVPKETALLNYQQSAKDTPELLAPLQAIGENPFGPSL